MHPFYVVTTYQIVLNQYAEKNEHEWILKAVILKTESTYVPSFISLFSISNGDIKKFFFCRNFVNS